MAEPYTAIQIVMMPEGHQSARHHLSACLLLANIDMAGAIGAPSTKCKSAAGNPKASFVTVAINRVEFKKPVLVGDVVKFRTTLVKFGPHLREPCASRCSWNAAPRRSTSPIGGRVRGRRRFDPRTASRCPLFPELATMRTRHRRLLRSARHCFSPFHRYRFRYLRSLLFETAMSFSSYHLYFDDLEVGQEWTSGGRTITEADIVNFAGFQRRLQPDTHGPRVREGDAVFARPIAHGFGVFCIASGLGVMTPPVRTLALLYVRDWKFIQPVFAGDTLRWPEAASSEKTIRGRGRARRSGLAAGHSEPGRQGGSGGPGGHAHRVAVRLRKPHRKSEPALSGSNDAG